MLYPFFLAGILMVIFGILGAVAGFDMNSGTRCHGWREYLSNGLEMLKMAFWGFLIVTAYLLLVGEPVPE